ncbi:ATP-binding protein [Coniosporium tulheliwenetii]|uniref:ATP-binding protein n=1 Tax=Coniosporium tulheliwenetii TaxID=3383036 RepID=A0ACC2Z2X4_9PEZI|nr:ATP-binding protein [Cladosporium sp. JES 115]
MNPLSPGGAKNEVYNVRTDNILFIFTGAFIGLHKMILDRISRGSIGFGAHVRASSPETGTHDTMLRGEDALFKKHLPFYVAETHNLQHQSSSSSNNRGFPQHTSSAATGKDPQDEPLYNTLDLVEPSDLQKYGLIPELIGRIPISCALSPSPPLRLGGGMGGEAAGEGGGEEGAVRESPQSFEEYRQKAAGGFV